MAEDSACRIEGYVVEWAEWLKVTPPSYLPDSSPEARTLEHGSLRTVASDGGMVKRYIQQQRDAQLDERARKVQRVMHEMPPAMKQLIDVTYLESPHAALPTRAAALRLGINQTAYRIRKAQALAWIAGRLGLTIEVAS